MRYILSISILFLSSTSFANMGSVGEGVLGTGHLFLKENQFISLEYEDLHISLFKSYAEVRVEYTFKNTGAAQRIKAAFPCLTYQHLYETEWGDLNIEISNYRIAVDGKSIKSNFLKGKQYSLKLPPNFGIMQSPPRVFLSAFISDIYFD